MDIEEHYSQLLGINSPWDIHSVDLNITIAIEYTDIEGPCPECAALCPKHDDRKARTWRHLDTLQFATHLQSKGCGFNRMMNNQFLLAANHCSSITNTQTKVP